MKHRISEDLDFFIEHEEVNSAHIARFFKLQSQALLIKNIETRIVFGLFTYFLNFHDGSSLKIDFNYYPFPRIKKGLKYGNLEIESMYDISVDKVHTIALKPRARDFIDLYFIIKNQNFTFRRLLSDAKAKFDWDISPIELGTRLLDASKLIDYPRMIKKINHREWQNFFIEQAMDLKKDIFF